MKKHEQNAQHWKEMKAYFNRVLQGRKKNLQEMYNF